MIEYNRPLQCAQDSIECYINDQLYSERPLNATKDGWSAAARVSARNSLDKHAERNKTVCVSPSQRKCGLENAGARHDIAQGPSVEALNTKTTPSRNSFTDVISTNVTFLDRDKTEARTQTRNTGLSTPSDSKDGVSLNCVFIVPLQQLQKLSRLHTMAKPFHLRHLKNVIFLMQTWIQKKGERSVSKQRTYEMSIVRKLILTI